MKMVLPTRFSVYDEIKIKLTFHNCHSNNVNKTNTGVQSTIEMSCSVPGCEQATVAECPLLQFPRNESLRDRWHAAITAGSGTAPTESESCICSWHFGNAPLEEYREPRWFIDSQGQEVEIGCCRFCLKFRNRNEMICYDSKVGTQSVDSFLKQYLKVTLLEDTNYTYLCQECLVRVDLLRSWIMDVQKVEAEFRSMLVACTQESMVPFESIGKFECDEEASLDNFVCSDIEVTLLGQNEEIKFEVCMEDSSPKDIVEPQESSSEEIIQQPKVKRNAGRSPNAPNKPRDVQSPRKRGRRRLTSQNNIPTSKFSYQDIIFRKCFICNTLLEDRFVLLAHLTNEHANKIDYHCVECNKSFPLPDSYNYHLGFHDLEFRPLKCNFCSLGFRTNDSLRNHENKEHNAGHPKKIVKRIPRQYQCDSCGKTFKKNYQLQEHDDYYHKNRGARCKICAKVFPTKQALKKHQIVHSGARPYKCDHCGKSFGKSDALRYHQMKHQDNYAEWKAQQKEKLRPRQRFRQRVKTVRQEKEEEGDEVDG